MIENRHCLWPKLQYVAITDDLLGIELNVDGNVAEYICKSMTQMLASLRCNAQRRIGTQALRNTYTLPVNDAWQLHMRKNHFDVPRNNFILKAYEVFHRFYSNGSSQASKPQFCFVIYLCCAMGDENIGGMPQRK